MLTKVVRAITSWGEASREHASDTTPIEVTDLGLVTLPGHETISGWFVPLRDEPLISMLVPSTVANHLQLMVRLHRHDRGTETLLGSVPAIVFTETQQNRFAFHGTVDERDKYEILLTNISVRELYFSLALLVDQP